MIYLGKLPAPSASFRICELDLIKWDEKETQSLALKQETILLMSIRKKVVEKAAMGYLYTKNLLTA